MSRVAVHTFELANALYKNATVSFYTVVNGVRTSVLADLFASSYESDLTQLPNPQKLDSRGKFKQLVYIDEPVVGVVDGITVPTHETGVVGGPDAFYAFHATAAVQQVFPGAKTKADFGTQTFDASGDYDPATSTFTAPLAGYYEFVASMSNAAGMTADDVWKMTIEAAGSAAQVRGIMAHVVSDDIGEASLVLHVLLRLAADDTVICYLARHAGSGSYVQHNDPVYNFFHGRLIRDG